MCGNRLSLDDMLKRYSAVELRLVGAEDDGDDGSEGQGDGDNGTAEDKDKSQDESKSDKDGDDGDGEGELTLAQAQRKIAALEDEKTRHYNARTKAERERDALKTELAELRDKGVDDNGKQELSSLRAEVESLTARVSDLTLENAFLTANDYTWIDPEAALRLAEFGDVELDDSGKVHGLKSALEKLATSKPWLLAQEDDGKPAPKRSGNPPKRKEQQDDEKSRQAKTSKYRSKYPGLRR